MFAFILHPRIVCSDNSNKLLCIDQLQELELASLNTRVIVSIPMTLLAAASRDEQRTGQELITNDLPVSLRSNILI